MSTEPPYSPQPAYAPQPPRAPQPPCAGSPSLATWGRLWCLVNSVLIVLSFPFGTALGGYSMFLFFQSGARERYRQLALLPA